jgi:hypothetical protein
MPDYSLAPVDHQPDFDDYSLVPVDRDPFAADGVARQAQVQLAQTQHIPMQAQSPPQPQNPSQSSATGIAQPNAGAPADQLKGPLADRSSYSAPGDSFPTADAAATAALQDINRTSQLHGSEYAGRIYRKWFGFGDYSYTPPIEGTPFSSSPGNSLLTPLLHSLGVNAGTYHTHTRGTDPARDEEYSPGDTEKSDDEGVPSFLGTPSGAIYKYSPIPNQPSHGNVSVIGKTSAPALPPNSPAVLKSKPP